MYRRGGVSMYHGLGTTMELADGDRASAPALNSALLSATSEVGIDKAYGYGKG